MSNQFKKVVSILVLLSMFMCSQGVTTFAASCVNVDGSNQNLFLDETKEEKKSGYYYEQIKNKKSMTLLQNTSGNLDEENQNENLNNETETTEETFDSHESETETEVDVSTDENFEEEAEALDDETTEEETEVETEAEAEVETEAETEVASDEAETSSEAETEVASDEAETSSEEATEVTDETTETVTEEENKKTSESELNIEKNNNEELLGTNDDKSDEAYVPLGSKATDSDVFGAAHSHRLCGQNSCNHIGVANHSNFINYGQDTSGITYVSEFRTGGSQFLAADLDFTDVDSVTLTQDMYLCLNGHNLTNITFINGDYNLYITNCQTTEVTLSAKDGTELFDGATSIIAGGATINILADILLESEEDEDSIFYNINISPKSNIINTIVSAYGKLDMSNVSVSGFTKDTSFTESLFKIYTEANIYNLTATGNYFNTFIKIYDTAVLNTMEDSTISFSGNSGKFLFYQDILDEDTEVNVGYLNVNGLVSVLSQTKLTQIFRTTGKNILNINGEVNIQNLSLVTNNNVGAIISVLRSAKANINGVINVEQGTNTSSSAVRSLIFDSREFIDDYCEVNIKGEINISNFTVSNTLFESYYSTINIDGNINIDNVTVGSVGFLMRYASELNINTDAEVNIKNTTLTNTTADDNCIFGFWTGGEIFNIAGTVNITGSTFTRLLRSAGGSLTANISGVLNIGGEDDDDSNTFAIGILLNSSKNTVNVNGELNYINNTITKYAIYIEHGSNTPSEDNRNVMNIPGTLTLDSNEFTYTVSSGIYGQIIIGKEYITFTISGTFNILNNTLGQNTDFPLIDFANGDTALNYSLLEITGTVNMEGNTSKSFMIYGGNTQNSTGNKCIKIGGKLNILNNDLMQQFETTFTGGTGFVNSGTDIEWTAEVYAEGNKMCRFLWFKSTDNTCEITSKMTFINNTFYREAIASRGTLYINADIVMTGNTFGYSAISTCEYHSSTGSYNTGNLYVNANITIKENTIKNGNTSRDSSIEYYDGSIIMIGSDFVVSNGYTVDIEDNILYRLDNKSQSIIRIYQDNTDFSLSNSGNLKIVNNYLNCDTAGSDNTSASVIYAQPGLSMQLGNGLLYIKNNVATGSNAETNIYNHFFGIYAENIAGFISQISNTKFNTSANYVENVAFNTADRQGVIYLDWKNGASSPASYDNSFTADTFGQPDGINLHMYYDASEGNLWISDGTPIHSHKLCGIDSDATCNHTGIDEHGTMFYTKLTPDDDFPTFGSVYLTEDYTFSENTSIVLTSDLYICLNGHNLANCRFQIDGYTLYMTNCSDEEVTMTSYGTTGVAPFLHGLVNLVSSKGTINLVANILYFDNNTTHTFRKNESTFYNVKTTMVGTGTGSGNSYFISAHPNMNVVVSSVSIADVSSQISIVRITGASSNISFYDTTFKNITVTANNSLFFNNADSELLFKNCTFDNVVTGTTSSGYGRFMDTASGNITVDGCSFNNCAGYARFFAITGGSPTFTVNDSTFTSCKATQYNMFYVAGDSGAKMLFTGENTIDSCTSNTHFFALNSAGIYFENTGILNITNNTIGSNFFTYNATGGDFISSSDGSVLNIKNNTIAGSMFTVDIEAANLSLGGEVNIEGNTLSSSDAGAAILYSAYNTTLSGNINITGNTCQGNGIINLVSDLSLDDDLVLNITSNNIIRKTNINQSIVYINGCNLNMNNSSITIKDNLVNCDTEGSSGYIVAGILLLDSNSSINIGNGSLIVRDNTTENDVTGDANHFYGIVSNKADGFIIQNENTTFNQNNYFENIMFNTTDGFGLIYDSDEDLSAYMTADTTKDSTLITRYYNGYMYIMDSSDPHYHTICGRLEGESCVHYGIDEHTEYYLYSKLSDASSFPTEGKIYLNNDINMTSSITLTNDLYLCLNGKNLTFTANSTCFQQKGYNIYISNCVEDSPTIKCQTGTNFMFRRGAIQMLSSAGTINVNTNAFLDTSAESSSYTAGNIDTVIYNVAFTPVATSFSGAEFVYYRSLEGCDFTISSASITGYNITNKTQFNFDRTDVKHNFYMYNTIIDNIVCTDNDYISLGANGGDVIFENTTYNECNFGAHCLIAVRANTKAVFKGETNVIKTSMTTTTAAHYLFYLSSADSEIEFNGVTNVDEATMTTQSGGYSCVLQIKNGTVVINDEFNLTNSTISATNSGKIASFAYAEAGSLIINGAVNINNNTMSSYSSSNSSFIMFTNSGSSFELNGELNFDDNDFSGLDSVILLNNSGASFTTSDESKININKTSVRNSILNLSIDSVFNSDINIDECESANDIIIINGNATFNNKLTITDSTSVNNIIEVSDGIIMPSTADLTITGNTITRGTNKNQAVINMTTTGVEVTMLGTINISNNTVLCSASGTENTYVSTIYIPEGSYWTVGDKIINITNNTQTGDYADTDSYTHMYGILSNNILGFMILNSSIHQSSVIQNIGFTSTDGSGIVIDNWGDASLVEGMWTADTKKQSDLDVYIFNKQLWIKDSTAPHYHKTCGLSLDEECNTTTHKNLTDTHEDKYYTKITNDSVFPFEGYIYLAEDLTINTNITLTNNLYICLNGYTFTVNARFTNSSGYNLYFTNCAENEANINVSAASANNDHFLRGGSLQIISAKAPINFSADKIVWTNQNNYNDDIIFYNVLFTPTTTSKVSRTGTVINDTVKDVNNRMIIASCSFADFNTTGTFIYKNSTGNMYFYDTTFTNITNTSNLISNNSTNQSVDLEFIMENCHFDTISTTNGGDCVCIKGVVTANLTDNTFENISGYTSSGSTYYACLAFRCTYYTSDSVNYGSIINTYGTNTFDNIHMNEIIRLGGEGGSAYTTMTINDVFIAKDSTIERHNPVLVYKSTLKVTGSFTISNITSGNSTIYTTNGFEVDGNMTFDNVQVTNAGQSLLDLQSGPTVLITGDLDIINNCLTAGPVIKLCETVKLEVNGDLNIKDYSTTYAYPIISMYGSGENNLKVDGDINFENITSTNGSIVSLDTSKSGATCNLTVGGNVNANNITLASTYKLINCASQGYVNIGENINIDTVVGGTNGIIYNNKELNVTGDIIATNVTANILLEFTSNGTETIGGDIIVTDSSFTDSSKVLKLNGTNLTVGGDIEIDGISADVIFDNSNSALTFGLAGKLNVTYSTVSTAVFNSAVDLNVNDDWTISNNTFDKGILTLTAGNINVLDGKTLKISDNYFTSNTSGQNAITLSGDGSLINLNETGNINITNNQIFTNEEAETLLAMVSLSNGNSAINIGNGNLIIKDNIATGDYVDDESNIVYGILSQNADGFIVQNENTKFNTTNNMVENLGIYDGSELIEGTVYKLWTSDNVNPYTKTTYKNDFTAASLLQSEIYFGLYLTADNNLVLKSATHSDHLICGSDEAAGCEHSDFSFSHKESDSSVIGYQPLFNEEDINNGGDYFLISDLVFDTVTTINPTSKLRLCLNGFNIINAKFRFDAVETDDEADKSIHITNCVESDTDKSVIEYSGSDNLFDNMIILTSKIDSIVVKANYVMNGSLLAAYGVDFEPYDETTTVANVFNYTEPGSDGLKSLGKGFEQVTISNYKTATNIINATSDIYISESVIENTENANLIINSTAGLHLVDIDISANENLKTGIMKATDLTLYASDENNGNNISDNTIIRKNAVQTLVDISVNIKLSSSSINVTNNTITCASSTNDTNYLSVFNLSETQYIEFSNSSYVNIAENTLSGSNTEAGGNHLFGIITKNPDFVFMRSADTDKFNAADTLVQSVAFDTEEYTGTIFANWTDEYIDTDGYSLSDYSSTFLLDTYLNDEINMKIDKTVTPNSLVIFRAEVFYVIYEAGSLTASDGNNYSATGTMEEAKVTEGWDDEAEESTYMVTTAYNEYSLEGGYIAGWQPTKEGYTNTLHTENETFDATELLTTDSSGRHVVYLVASWSEVTYNIIIDLQGGEMEGQIGGNYEISDLKYYTESEPLPKASKSNVTFLYYEYDYTNTEDGADNIGDFVPNVTKLYAGDTVYKNYSSRQGAEIYYKAMFADNNAEFTVNFIGNGATNTMASRTYIYTDTNYVPASTFTRSGYTFTGWAKTQNGAVVYKPGDVFNEDLSVVDTGLTLYASWKRSSSSDDRGGRSSSSGGDGGGSSSVGPIATNVSQSLYNYVEVPYQALGAKTHNEVGSQISWIKTPNSWMAYKAGVNNTYAPLTDGMYYINWNNKNCYYAFDRVGNLIDGFVTYNGVVYFMADGGVFEGALTRGLVNVNGTSYAIGENGQVQSLIDTKNAGVFIYDMDQGQYRYLVKGNTLNYAVNTMITIEQNGKPVSYIFGLDGLMRVGAIAFGGNTYFAYESGDKYGQIMTNEDSALTNNYRLIFNNDNSIIQLNVR